MKPDLITTAENMYMLLMLFPSLLFRFQWSREGLYASLLVQNVVVPPFNTKPSWVLTCPEFLSHFKRKL